MITSRHQHLLERLGPPYSLVWYLIVLVYGMQIMMLNEKGYDFTVLLFGLFSVISVQKAVRDKLEDIQVTEMYYGISWFTSIAAIVLLVIGLWNADLELSEKGFYGMSFTLSLFAAIAVQKNTRDVAYIDKEIETKNED